MINYKGINKRKLDNYLVHLLKLNVHLRPVTVVYKRLYYINCL